MIAFYYFMSVIAGILVAYYFIELFAKPSVGLIKAYFNNLCTKKTSDYSLEDVQKMLEDQEFIQMIADYLDGKSQAKPLDGSSKFIVLKPCEAHNCPLHVTREDAC